MTMQSLSTTTTELKPVELQSYLDEGWRIFVDTCSFMSSGCEPFFTRSAAAFRDAGVSIHCPKEVRRELEKNLSSPKEQTRQLAMRGLAAYDALDKLDVLREIDCPGSQENVFADPVFAKIFDEQRAEHKLLLITQDRRLAAGLYSRNQDEFMHFHPVHVLRLLSRGDLGFLNHPQTQELIFPPNMNDFSRQSVPMIRAHLVSSEAVPPAGRSVPRTVSAGHTGDVREASRPEKESVSKVVSKPAVPAVEKAAPALHAAFPVCTSVIDLEDRPVGIDRAPVEGDVVCDEFGMTHTLGRRLGEGGEGIVYDAGNGMVAKIYHADKCTTRREAKVRLLASRPIRLKGVCAPQRMLFSNGFFAGCLMPEAKGFGLEGPLDKCFAGWSLRLNAYRERLLDGTLLADDPLANEIYPKTGRKILPPARPACVVCGRPHDETDGRNGVCSACISIAERVLARTTVRAAGTPAPSAPKSEPKASGPETAASEDKPSDTAYERTCVDCGSLFRITKGEAEHLRNLGYRLPARCKACRAERRARKKAIERRSDEDGSILDEILNGVRDLIKPLA